MKLSLLLRPSLWLGMLFSVTSVIHQTAAQDLPRTTLQLPPLPTLALTPAHSRLAGLPGGPPAVYVPISHLTLPEKPATLAVDLPADSKDSAIPASAVPEDLLPVTENPLLPNIITNPTEESEHSPAALSAVSDLPEQDSVAPADPNIASVLDSDLSPAPNKSLDAPELTARGPLFRIKGADVFVYARALGYHFTPAQGLGRRDGMHTVASQIPNVLTSEVHGPRMMQLRPSSLWSTPYIENTFYMFCDPSYNAVRLQPGWKIRGIQLKGPNWQWLACPKSGANTASFSVRIRAYKTVDTPAQGSVVTLEGLTLEGPAGATNWKTAFRALSLPANLAAQR